MLIISRFVFKFFFALISSKELLISNALIYGAGASGRITYEVLNREKKNTLQVLGFIDDDKKKIGRKFRSKKILNISKKEINKKNMHLIDTTKDF